MFCTCMTGQCSLLLVLYVSLYEARWHFLPVSSYNWQAASRYYFGLDICASVCGSVRLSVGPSLKMVGFISTEDKNVA